jgi:hypothetical protein
MRKIKHDPEKSATPAFAGAGIFGIMRQEPVMRRYLSVAPNTNAFNACQSGSFFEANCWPPP